MNAQAAQLTDLIGYFHVGGDESRKGTRSSQSVAATVSRNHVNVAVPAQLSAGTGDGRFVQF